MMIEDNDSRLSPMNVSVSRVSSDDENRKNSLGKAMFSAFVEMPVSSQDPVLSRMDGAATDLISAGVDDEEKKSLHNNILKKVNSENTELLPELPHRYTRENSIYGQRSIANPVNSKISSVMLKIGQMSDKLSSKYDFCSRGTSELLGPTALRECLNNLFKLDLSYSDIELLFKKFDVQSRGVSVVEIMGNAKMIYDAHRNKEALEKKIVERDRKSREQFKLSALKIQASQDYNAKSKHTMEAIMLKLSKAAYGIMVTKSSKLAKIGKITMKVAPFRELLRDLAVDLTAEEDDLLLKRYYIQDARKIDFLAFKEEFLVLGKELMRSVEQDEETSGRVVAYLQQQQQLQHKQQQPQQQKQSSLQSSSQISIGSSIAEESCTDTVLPMSISKSPSKSNLSRSNSSVILAPLQKLPSSSKFKFPMLVSSTSQEAGSSSMKCCFEVGPKEIGSSKFLRPINMSVEMSSQW